MKRKLEVLLGCAGLIEGLFVLTLPASATSIYDSTVQPISSVHVKIDDCNEDVTSTWPDLVAERAEGGDLIAQQIDSRVKSHNSGLAVTQMDYPSGESQVIIYEFTSTNALVFENLDGFPNLKSLNTVNRATISCSNGKTKVVTTGSFSLTTIAVGSDYSSLGWLGNRQRPLFIDQPVSYPTSYEGAYVSSAPPPVKYAAMGDSFSSGEGNPSFEYGTDVDGTNENRCHRSPQAYPRLLDQDSSLNLGRMDFVACSGATTSDVLYGSSGSGNWDEGPQVDALSSDTQVVTITIGGNDLGFSSVMERCAYSARNEDGWGCSNDTSLRDSVTERMSALSGDASSPVYNPDGKRIYSIKDVIETIAEDAPNASIYIAGYPHLFGSSASDFDTNVSAPSGSSCEVWLGANYDYDDAQWINDGVDDLNTAIQGAVSDAQNENIDITYVSPALFGSHANCDSDDAWIYPVIITDPPTFEVTPTSFHPTETGQAMGYEAAFGTYIS